MRRLGVMQIGDGPGVPVEHITDSGVLGVAKPDPTMFLATAAGLGLPPESICHVGDSGCYDADGASAVGCSRCTSIRSACVPATTVTWLRSPNSPAAHWRRVERPAERAFSSPDVRIPPCRAVS
jgi:FMN phosphatase YigB (HAD superfamily)